jgi:hypothetical protein
VTVLALVAVLAFVAIIVLMAAMAGLREFLLDILWFVAAVTSGFFVFSGQREISLPVVVEVKDIPLFLAVTGFTFVAKTATMNVIDLVAAYALFWCVLVFLISVAGRTTSVLMGSFEWKISFVVIKPGLLPSTGLVTVTTFLALFPLMHIC